MIHTSLKLPANQYHKIYSQLKTHGFVVEIIRNKDDDLPCNREYQCTKKQKTISFYVEAEMITLVPVTYSNQMLITFYVEAFNKENQNLTIEIMDALEDIGTR